MLRLWCRISELVRGTDLDAALYGSLELRMPREIVGKGLRFSLRHAPCAQICRYCLISKSRKRSALRFPGSSSAFIVFTIGSQSDGCEDIEIGIFGARPNRLWDRDHPQYEGWRRVTAFTRPRKGCNASRAF